MFRKTLITLTAFAAFGAVTVAQSQQSTPASPSTDKVTVHVTKTSPIDGKQMFGAYCAPCHGSDAKGNGPAASVLKVPPTDLTVLAKNHGGKYPDTHVTTVLQFGSEMPAHGSAQMPIWGPILGRMNHGSPQDKQLRIANISRYLGTLQVK